MSWICACAGRAAPSEGAAAAAGGSGACASLNITPRFIQTWIAEGQGLHQGLVQAGAVESLGAMPLIVLTRGLTAEPDPEWQTHQTGFLQLSSNSQGLFADNSGHNIEYEQPLAAVGAITQMVEQVRQHPPR
ncbi:MAG: hypothetical protein EXR58_01535 [Chloroflexi bacterium]|nr:hypothetical protein [Chloroflexota bacterium]